MKNRHSENKTSVTILAAKNMAEGLRLIAAEYDRLAKAMDGCGGLLEAPGLITGMDGLLKVSRFCANIQEAYIENLALDSTADIAGAAHELKRRIHRLKSEVEAAKDEADSIASQGEEAKAGMRQKVAEKQNRKKSEK